MRRSAELGARRPDHINRYAGTFAATNWTYSFLMRVTTGSLQRETIRATMWRGVAADGSDAVQIASGTAETGITPIATTTNTTPITATVNPGALTLNGEYLWFVITWRTTTLEGVNLADWRIVSDTNSKIVTSDFTPTPTDTITLDWADNAESDLSHYRVYRSTTSRSGYVLLADNVVGSTYTDTTALEGTTYYYVVRAVDLVGNESGNSNEASFQAAPVLSVSMSGHAGGSAFGLSSFALRASPNGISGSAAFGSSSVLLRASPNGVPGTADFGSLSAVLRAALSGHAGASAFGLPSVALQAALSGLTAPSTFGLLTAALRIQPDSHAGSAAFGSPTILAPELLSVLMSGHAGSVDFGLPGVLLAANFSEHVGASAFGSLDAKLRVAPDGLVGVSAFGLPSAALRANLTGHQAQAESGLPSVALLLGMNGLVGATAFGSPSMALRASLLGLTGGAGFGYPTRGPVWRRAVRDFRNRRVTLPATGTLSRCGLGLITHGRCAKEG